MADDFLGRYHTRAALSVLILLSICPFDFIDTYWWAFFAVFGFEFAVRLSLTFYLGNDEASTRDRLFERLFLLPMDLIATLSFLPLSAASAFRFLRLARFARLGLLVSYWGPTFRMLIRLLRREERTRQLKLLLGSVVGLTFVAAALLGEFASSINPEELGLTSPVAFSDLLWWSFRQIQDPGNLVASASHIGILITSLLMTTGGIFIFSFVIGIGTSVVAELLEATREQPIGLRKHSLLINAGQESRHFLDLVVDYYRKQLVSPRWIVMGREHSVPEIANNTRYRRIAYREGTAYHPDDLHKIDAAHARRVVILADPDLAEPDPETIAAVLSVRQVNPRAEIFAEIHDIGNTPAVAAAGADTVIVHTEHLLAVVIANLLAVPSLYELVEELLTAHGNEVYSMFFPRIGANLPELLGTPDADLALQDWAYRQHGCLLLGTLQLGERRVEVNLNTSPSKEQYAGLIGLAGSFKHLQAVAKALAESGIPTERPDLAQQAAALPSLRRSPDPSIERRLLLCGFQSRTPMLIEHFLRLCPKAHVFWMVGSEDEVERARAELIELGRLRAMDTVHSHALPIGRFEPTADHGLVYITEAGVRAAEVHLLVGNWASRESLLQVREGYDLFEMDQVLIQSVTQSDGDPDAKSVLAVLKIANLFALPQYQDRFRDDFQVLVEIVDPLKATLIESRFGDEAIGPALPVAVVTTERLRNILMFQATVVPEFGTIFTRLFGHTGQSLHRLELGDPTEEGAHIHFGDLMAMLYGQMGVILVAVERPGYRGADSLLIAPHPNSPEADLDLAEVSALFVLGPKAWDPS